MEAVPPPSTSRFRFRDHNNELENGESVAGDTSTESSSVSSDEGSETESDELASMTAKGINHLCLELAELKQASEMDFQENIISYYSSFIRIFKETKDINNEVMQLKHQLMAHKQLVQDLTDGVYVKILSDDKAQTLSEKPAIDEQDPMILFKTHADEVLVTLDSLLSEQRLDKAFEIFEMEDGASQHVEFQKDLSPEIWMSYKSAMTERRVMLADKLTLAAESSRVSAAELQKALVGLSRLGFDHLATRLLLKYYHSRIARGINDLQSSKTFLHGVYVCNLARFVFSMISQAAKTFIVLHGETSRYHSDLMKWACEETETFAACFSEFVKSVSEISGGLSTVVDSVHFAMSYCSLLESQNLALQPCLIQHILPWIEGVLKTHFDHFKKVISIFTSSDAWVVGRYLVSGMLLEGNSSTIVEQHAEYCLLTNSGRKFVTLLQAVTKDISSLISIFGSSILDGVMGLFTEYTIILERALLSELNVVVEGGSKINIAKSPSQQVSLIANLLTLEHFFSIMIRNIFKDINLLNIEIDTQIASVQDNCNRLRTRFCKQFIDSIMSNEAHHTGIHIDSNLLQDMMPSPAYQVLFLELKKVEELGEDSAIQVNWLMHLLTELMETLFDWISSNGEIWLTSEEDSTDQQSDRLTQFALDMHFLVEIARRGGYLTTNMINTFAALVSRVRSALVTTGFDEKRYVTDYEKVAKSATEAFKKLELEEAKWHSDEDIDQLDDEIEEYQLHSASDSIEDDDAQSSLDVSFEATEVTENNHISELASSTGTKIHTTETTHRCSSDSQEDVNNCGTTSTACTGSHADEVGTEIEAGSIEGELKEIKKSKLQKLPLLTRSITANSHTQDVTTDEHSIPKPENQQRTSDELMQLRKIKRVSTIVRKQ